MIKVLFYYKKLNERKNMGAYINPQNESKESFLNREGIETLFPEWEEKPDGYLPVVLINNRFFTAAGIVYCKEELDIFALQQDNRKKTFYYVSIEKLLDVSNLGQYL